MCCKLSLAPNASVHEFIFSFPTDFPSFLFPLPFEQTKRPKHYAFVKFENESVARIAAESMDNYLMFGKRMRCTFIPGKQIPRAMFPRLERTKTTIEAHKEACNKEKTPQSVAKLASQRKRQVHKALDKLKELGIDFSCVIINEPELTKKKKTQTMIPNVESIDDDTQNGIQDEQVEEQVPERVKPSKGRKETTKKATHSKLKVETIKPGVSSNTRSRVFRPRPLLR